MGSFTGIISASADSCACIAQSRIKKLAEKVELYFFLSEIIVCYCQEGKYSGYHKLNKQ